MAYSKPLPNVENPETARFWEGTGSQKLVVQRCAHCGYHRFPPGLACPECQTIGGDWIEIRPTGVLYSYCTYRRGLDPNFKDDLPYTVGYIHLDDGVTMIGTVLGDPESLVVDAPVRAVFDAVTPEVTLVRWELAG